MAWHRLPCAIRQHIFEYDPTYRTVFTDHCLPFVCAAVWQRRIRGLTRMFKERKEDIESTVATSAYTVDLEYELFCRRREIYFYTVLLRFIDVYFAPRKDQMPPDRMTLVMTLYNNSLTLVDNEDQAGRFFVEWEITPVNEFFAGYVIGQTEFCKQFYHYGTQNRPDLAVQPLATFTNGMCWDQRRFQWQDNTFVWYDVLYVYNDALVIFEHDIELEPV